MPSSAPPQTPVAKTPVSSPTTSTGVGANMVAVGSSTHRPQHGHCHQHQLPGEQGDGVSHPRIPFQTDDICAAKALRSPRSATSRGWRMPLACDQEP